MTLSQRLTTLFDDGSNAYYRHNGIGSAEAYDNKKEADVQRTIATIQADLKGLLPKDKEHEAWCDKSNSGCDCGADGYNQALADTDAAIEHYTRDKV
jgi:hypothetical protein